MTRTLTAVRDGLWAAMLTPSGTAADGGLYDPLEHALLVAAAGTPLRRLFPFNSANTLHFSRCSDFPFTDDCPWVRYSPDSAYVVHRPFPDGVQRDAAWFPPDVIAETDDAELAIAAIVRELPAHWATVWLGHAGEQPS